jgi:hypothetical protein
MSEHTLNKQHQARIVSGTSGRTWRNLFEDVLASEEAQNASCNSECQQSKVMSA